MTHKEQLLHAFDALGIAYQQRAATEQAYTSEEGSVSAKEWDSAIDLREGLGLPGFVTSFYFDDEEVFLSHRVWKAV